MPDDKVRLVHPDLPDSEYYCGVDAVAGWVALGWQEAKPTKKEKA